MIFRVIALSAFLFMWWLIFRSLIKEGSAKTTVPAIFLLGNEYRVDR